MKASGTSINRELKIGWLHNMTSYEDKIIQQGGTPWMVDQARKLDLFGQDGTVDAYNKLLTQASERSGVDKETIELVMNYIAYHESDRTMDPGIIHPNAGRGLFGYEIGPDSDIDDKYENPSGSGRTAMNRLYSRMGGRLATEYFPKGKQSPEVLEFMKEYFDGVNPKGDVDFAQLGELEQKVLFLADHIEAGDFDRGGARLLRVGDYASWWGEFHHRGEDPDYDVFRGNVKDYNINK